MHFINLRGLKPVLLAAIAITWAGCSHQKNELAHDHSHHHHHDSQSELREHAGHEHGHDAEAAHNHEGEILLEPSRAAKLGVVVSPAAEGEFATTVAATGELQAAPSSQSVVAAPSAGIVSLTGAATLGATVGKGTTLARISGKTVAGGDANANAMASLNAAKRELDRITPLHSEGIVSTRDYNAALEAYELAKAAASGATASGGSSATAATSGTIVEILVGEGEFVEAGAPIARVADGSRLTLRADLPRQRADFLSQISGARFRAAGSDRVMDIADFNGQRTPGAGIAAGGYIPVYFTLQNHDGVLQPGGACEVFLTGNSCGDVMSLPVSALSEQQGEFFVYIRVHPDSYEKRHVRVGGSMGNRVQILSGVQPGEEVVTEGVTFVRLAENSSVVPEGHSHNH